MSKQKHKGAMIVQVALLLPIFLYLVMGLIFVGICVRDATVASNIVRESGRYAAVQLAADPKEEKDALGDKCYVMVAADEGEVKAKIHAFTKKQCEEMLALYICQEEPTITITNGSGHDANKENKQVEISFKVELEEPYTYMGFGFCPKYISRRVVFRIEDHSIQIKDNG